VVLPVEMSRRKPFTLVTAPASQETVKALEELLDEARRGEVIGIAFAAMCRKRTYFVNAVGEAYRNPTFARGMVSALHDDLGRRIRSHTARED
jgi:hypothetical protein